MHNVETLAPQQAAERQERTQVADRSERTTEGRQTVNTNSGRNRYRLGLLVPVREVHIMTDLAKTLQRVRDIPFRAASKPMRRSVEYLHNAGSPSDRAYARSGTTPSSAYTFAIPATVASGAKRCRTIPMP